MSLYLFLLDFGPFYLQVSVNNKKQLNFFLNKLQSYNISRCCCLLLNCLRTRVHIALLSGRQCWPGALFICLLIVSHICFQNEHQTGTLIMSGGVGGGGVGGGGQFLHLWLVTWKIAIMMTPAPFLVGSAWSHQKGGALWKLNLNNTCSIFFVWVGIPLFLTNQLFLWNLWTCEWAYALLRISHYSHFPATGPAKTTFFPTTKGMFMITVMSGY